MREKSRIIISATSNADVSHILPFFYIGKPKKPVCFALSEESDKVETCCKNQKNS